MARKSFRDVLRDNDAAQRYYAGDRAIPAELLNNVGAKRVIVNRSNAEDLEAATTREIADAIRNCHQVVFAVRINSGSAIVRGRNGKDIPIWFWKWIKSGEKMTLCDYFGALNTGMFVIEAKKRGWQFNPNNERECKQKAFVDLIISLGGRGGFATCYEQATAILEGK